MITKFLNAFEAWRDSPELCGGDLFDTMLAAYDQLGSPILIQVWACFELDDVDAPILRAVKTYGSALAWRDEQIEQRFLMPFTLDHVPHAEEDPQPRLV